MPKVHHVKKARKDVRGSDIKKGESYYWWAFMVGGRGGTKRVSRTHPRPSQLTQSEYLSTCLAAQESVQDANVSDIDTLISTLESAKDEISNQADECDNKYNNMPDSLQQGETGQLLESRRDAAQAVAEAIDEAIGQLNDLSTEFEEDHDEGEDDDLIDRAQDIIDGIDWEFGD